MISVLDSPVTASELLGALERRSDRSLYEQIVDRLRQLSAHSECIGAQVPTEDELTRIFGVSRVTVRRAIGRLVEENVLVRRRGKGTFISKPLPSIVYPIDRVAPFFETFQKAGEDFNTEVTDYFWDDGAKLPAQLCEWTRPVLNIRRRYVTRSAAHAVTHIAVPLEIGQHITREEISRAPIYELLQKKLKLELHQSEFLVSCQQPTAEVSESLGVSRSSFLLVLDRITRDAKGKAVEVMTHYLRPDVYKLSVTTDIRTRLPE